MKYRLKQFFFLHLYDTGNINLVNLKAFTKLVDTIRYNLVFELCMVQRLIISEMAWHGFTSQFITLVLNSLLKGFYVIQPIVHNTVHDDAYWEWDDYHNVKYQLKPWDIPQTTQKTVFLDLKNSDSVYL